MVVHQNLDNYSQILVFTDLDGTLLGHHDYAYKPVLPVLQQLDANHIPVILNSSKTFAEIASWLKKLDLKGPFIAENGGVIYLPDGEKKILGKPYKELRKFLLHIRETKGWQFKGFGDMSPDEIAELTGLKSEDAGQASMREVSEPIQWLDSDAALKDFTVEVEQAGLQLLRGGRFYHLMAIHDKAYAMRYLIDSGLLNSIVAVSRQDCYVVALGDGENDRKMLQQADLAIVLPAANFSSLQLSVGQDGLPARIVYSEQPSPEGWASSVNEYLVSKIS